MRRTGAVSAFLLSLSCAACASYPGLGPHGFSLDFPYAPPADAAALGDFLVARYAAMTDDPREAANRYAASIDTAPESAGIAERAVFSALLTGNYPQAVRLANKAHGAGNFGTLVRLTLGIEAFTKGKDSVSAAYLSEDGFGPFNRTVARGVSAWRILEADGPEATETYLRETLTGDPRLDSATLYMMGLIQLAAHNDADALETFETLWSSGARLAIGLDAHARLLAANGDRARALSLLTSFHDEIGENSALESLRKDIQAGRDIQVTRLTPRQGAALAVYVPAAALITRTDDDVASVYFVLALALDPDLHEARTLWAQSLEKAGREIEAISVLADVPDTSPYYAPARGQIAWALLRLGREEEAVQVARQALAQSPDRGLRVQLAEIYRAQARYREAARLLTDIIKDDALKGREDWRLLFSRGATRHALDDWAGTEADLKQALQIEPNSPLVLNYLGYAYVDQGIHLEEGLDLIRTALTYDPDSGFITDSLGWAYYRLGRYELAIYFLEKAVELEPGDPTLNDHLGDAYWRSGRKLEAKYQWERSLRLEPAEQERARIEVKLLRGPDEPAVVQAESDQPLPHRP
ncbi:tetratricopeptide repeat protein [uncultured Hyphomonas sp.]|uniref:tetratricopeptide repeat protein n=1 Tax=uncultured Hyphomonas sp. TaxID=225298 RepID=UPI003748C1F6